MLKMPVYIVLTGLLVVVLIFGAGLLLPKERYASRKVAINASSENLWGALTEVGRYNIWRKDIEKTKILKSSNGALVWIEYPKSGKPVKFTEGKKDKNRQWRLDWEDTSGLASGYWIGTITKTSTGVEFESQEHAVIKNPFIRVLSYLFFDMEDVIKQFQSSLKAQAENPASAQNSMTGK